jgi:hypothetical protein
MKLKTLKQIVWQTWHQHHKLERAIAVPETFKPEMRRYGDLRRRATWEAAYAALQAAIIDNPVLEPGMAIQIYFTQPEEPQLVEYNDQVLSAYLQFPHALEAIRDGLEQLFYQPCDPEDREDAIAFIQRLRGLPQILEHDSLLRGLLAAAA